MPYIVLADDSRVDPAKVVTSALLPPPATTIGDADTTLPGINAVSAVMDNSVSDPPDPPSSGHTFFVSNTHNDDCPQAMFTTIQSAVNASGPNDSVKVCPGTYTEQVVIMGHQHDGLRLESVNPLAATIQWPAVEMFPLALVDFNNA